MPITTAYDEALMHHRLTKKWNCVLEEVHISSGRTYFWTDTIGYSVAYNQNLEKQLIQTDSYGINSIRESIKDWDVTHTDLQQLKIDLIMVKDKVDLPVNLLFTLACMFTNFMQDIPVTEEGDSSNNIFGIPGQTKCYSKDGIQMLQKYDTIREGIESLCGSYNINQSDSYSFNTLYNELNFSLTMYRFYHMICMVFLKGGVIYAKDRKMDLFGDLRRYRHYSSSIKRKGFRGENISRNKRPLGGFNSNNRREEKEVEGGGDSS